jgi:nitrate/nitrite transport system substrate-binding protein
LRPKVHLYATGKVMQNNQPLPMYTLLNLNEQCQAISVAQTYAETGVGLDSSPLREVFAAKKASGAEVPVAMTFPGGTHDLWMRYWLAAGGIDPTKDVNLIVVPPPQMVANMKVGNMEAFCVGEPWNEQLVNQGIGFTAATTGELWARHPEKVLGMRADWVDANPNATVAIIAAVIEAQMWCEDAANKDEMAEIVGRRQWYNVPVEDIIGRIKGDMNYGNGRVETKPDLAMKFWGDKGESSYPWKSLDSWFITENKRWGTLPGDLDTAALVAQTNRSDLWLQAAAALGIDTTGFGDSRGVETFFDGKSFDPANPDTYLDSLAIKAMA